MNEDVSIDLIEFVIAETGITEQSIPEITLQGKPIETDHSKPTQSDQSFIDQFYAPLLAA